jgi:Holliday junction resolvase RusA-like endonuclease
MIVFRVHGDPLPKGSKTARIVNGRVVGSYEAANMKRKNRRAGGLDRWMLAVAWAGKSAFSRQRTELLEEALGVTLTFYFERPATVTRPMPSVKPDGDKLARAVLDALTGVLWKDDSQVTTLLVVKRYGSSPGVGVHVFADALEKGQG